RHRRASQEWPVRCDSLFRCIGARALSKYNVEASRGSFLRAYVAGNQRSRPLRRPVARGDSSRDPTRKVGTSDQPLGALELLYGVQPTRRSGGSWVRAVSKSGASSGSWFPSPSQRIASSPQCDRGCIKGLAIQRELGNLG